jgi:hypothetical protein
MATTEQVRDALHAIPFRPFRIRLAGGRIYTVRQPDFVALPPRGREMAFYETVSEHDDPILHRIAIGLVREILDEAGPPATPKPDDQ